MITDKIGQEIKVGSYIAYGHALGRCAGIRIGKVLKLESKITKPWGNDEQQEYRITVLGVDDDWTTSRWVGQKPFESIKLNSKKGTLQFPERIIVLEDLPQVYKDLLDPVPTLE